MWFKVDDGNRADYEAAGSQPFRPFDSATVMSYWEVPADVLDDRAAIVAWGRKAIDAQLRSKAPKKRKTPKR